MIVFILIHRNLACVNVYYDMDCYAIGRAGATDGVCSGGDVQWLVTSGFDKIAYYTQISENG